MYDRGKYIVGSIVSRVTGAENDAAICFSELVGHDDIAPVFKTIVSAGFFVLHVDKNAPCGITVAPYGKSTSLNTIARLDTDVQYIMRALGLDPM